MALVGVLNGTSKDEMLVPHTDKDLKYVRQRKQPGQRGGSETKWDYMCKARGTIRKHSTHRVHCLHEDSDADFEMQGEWDKKQRLNWKGALVRRDGTVCSIKEFRSHQSHPFN